MHFFNKNVCVFFDRVCFFLPRSLVPFGKNLDSKCTIYFEWPNMLSQTDKSEMRLGYGVGIVFRMCS